MLLSTPSFALYIDERMNQRGIDPSDMPLRIGCFGGEGGAEVPPGVALVASGALEQTMFKAKRVVDERAKAE